jgi:hypothetical protein
MKRPDWAERQARKFCGDHQVPRGCTDSCCPTCGDIVRALRRAEKRGYRRGLTEGVMHKTGT